MTLVNVIKPQPAKQSTIKSQPELKSWEFDLPMYSVKTVDQHFSGDPIDHIFETAPIRLIRQANYFDKILSLVTKACRYL